MRPNEIGGTTSPTSRRRRVTAFHLLRARWYISAPIVLAAVIAAVWMEMTSPANFVARGSLLLVVPEVDPAEFQETEVTLSRTLDRLNTGEIQTELLADGARAEAITLDATTFELVVYGEHPRVAQRAMDATVAWLEADAEENQSQAGLNPREHVLLRDLTPDSTTTRRSDGLHEARKTIWLDDPRRGVRNPYGASAGTLRLLQVAAESEAGRQLLTPRLGQETNYWVELDQRDLAPLVTVGVAGTDADEVLQGFDPVAAFLIDELDGRQARAAVPPERRLRLELIAPPAEAVRTDRVPSITAIAIVLAGLLTAGATAAAVEWLTSRPSRLGPWPPELREPPTTPRDAIGPPPNHRAGSGRR